MSRNVLIGIWMATVSLGAIAQTADEHSTHHPATTPASNAAEAPSIPPAAKAQMAGMDQHMKAMQSMHEKMAAAKTPEERRALMAEHQKLMQDGMAMMKSMGSGMSGMGGMQGGKGMDGGMAACQQMMAKRMEMMESMLQMMMDRMPPVPTN